MEFKGERKGVISVGDEVSVIETVLDTFIFYTIEHSYGISGNIPFNQALQTRTAKVVSIDERKSGFYAILEFDE